MLKFIIFLSLIVTILTENAEVSQDNETVALLLPKLHLSALRARALHDINAARLRHHLPLRRHNLLLEGTPEFLRENDTLEEIAETFDNFENAGNNANKILNATQSIIKGIVSRNGDLDPVGSIEDIVAKSRSGLEEATENSREITSLLREIFYRILERQKNFSNGNVSSEKAPEANATISKEGMDFWKIMQENVEPFIKIDRDNFTTAGINDEVPPLFGLDENVPKVDRRTLDYLQRIFSNIVKEELSGLTRWKRDLVERPRDQVEFKDTVIGDRGNDEGNRKEEIVQYKHKKYYNGQRRINDERLFVESLNHLNRNVEVVGGRNVERAAEENDPESADFSRHGKGPHTHHIAFTHGVEHHPPTFSNLFVPVPFPNKHNRPFNSFHNHQKPVTSHVTINKQENFFPPHSHISSFNQHNFKRVGSDEDNVRRSFIIYAPRNRKPGHELFKRSVPLLKLMADPNVKLDMPKTIENIGTIAKNSFEDNKAPMYHIRNMVGSAKNVILAALRIPPQDAVIPTQYKIMDRSDLKKSPDVASRFAKLPDEDGFTETFKRVGLMLRESIKSGQETLQHMTDVAHSARKAIVTTGYATPRFLTPYVRATAIKKDETPEKLMLIAPRIGEVTDRDSSPDPTDDYVKIGDLMDALGVSNPEKKKVGLTRIVMHPKKADKIQSRFGNEKKKDFFLVAEHIDDGESPKGIKDVIKGFLNKSKSRDEKTINSKAGKVKEFLQNLLPLKNDNNINEIPGDFDEDVEEILKFDWEKIGAIPEDEEAKEVDTKTLTPNQNIDYNELYQKVIKEKN